MSGAWLSEQIGFAVAYVSALVCFATSGSALAARSLEWRWWMVAGVALFILSRMVVIHSNTRQILEILQKQS